jgi:hypothetical protein
MASRAWRPLNPRQLNGVAGAAPLRTLVDGAILGSREAGVMVIDARFVVRLDPSK